MNLRRNGENYERLFKLPMPGQLPDPLSGLPEEMMEGVTVEKVSVSRAKKNLAQLRQAVVKGEHETAKP